jgi:hypothetical protein
MPVFTAGRCAGEIDSLVTLFATEERLEMRNLFMPVNSDEFPGFFYRLLVWRRVGWFRSVEESALLHAMKHVFLSGSTAQEKICHASFGYGVFC